MGVFTLLLSWLPQNGSLGCSLQSLLTETWTDSASRPGTGSLGGATYCSLRKQLTFGKGSFIIHFCQWHIRRVGIHQEHLFIIAELKFSIERIYNWHRAVGLLERNGYQEPRGGRSESFLRVGSTYSGHLSCLLWLPFVTGHALCCGC